MSNKNLMLLVAAAAAYYFFFMKKKPSTLITSPGVPDQPVPVQAITMPAIQTNSVEILEQIKSFSVPGSTFENKPDNVYQYTYGTIQGVDYKVPTTC